MAARRTAKRKTNHRKQRTGGALFGLRQIQSATSQEKKIILIFGVIVVAAVILLYRLYSLQVIHGAEYRDRVSALYSNVVGNQAGIRGNIFFTYKNGDRLLVATNSEYYTLVINNRNVIDHDKVFRELNKVVEFSHERWGAIRQKENDPYEILVKRLSDEEFEAIQSLKLRGVELHANKERFYPAGDLGSNVIGFVSDQNGIVRGSYGLEKYYDNILRRDGEVNKKSIFFSLFGAEEVSLENETTIEKHIAKEGSLISHIEPNVQRYLEQELDKVSRQYRSEYSAGIVLDPDTGQVIALGVSDNFDLNTDTKHYRNYPIEDRRELGSIIKPLTVAIGLDSNTITPGFSYNDRGSMTIGRYTINNFDRQGRGAFTSLQKILTNSLNTGVATIALQIGFEIFTDYILALGFDTETGIDLPFEVYGLVGNLDSKRSVELATASFGQGIAPTALEMARAFASLASDGVVRTPYIVDLIEYGDLIPAKNVPAGRDERVFSATTVQTVTNMLTNIVDDSATFKPYSLPQHSIAIKTGTAQIANPRGGYYDDQFLHSMVGFFPAQAQAKEQQFLVLIYTLRPIGARYSSTTLKDPFFNMAKYLINYYDLKPDRNISTLDNIQ